jgi:methylmalonyl-CoA/ethylmalonyl-CoA epimerase
MAEPQLHHIGFVVESVEGSLPFFATSMKANHVSGVFVDPLQKVKVAFLVMGGPGEPQIELVAPMDSSSPVHQFLSRGGGLHHLCYEVDNLEWQLAEMKDRKAVLIRPPKPAVAFSGRRIAWMVTRERLVVEYLERPNSSR